jgi:hypothetical protein
MRRPCQSVFNSAAMHSKIMSKARRQNEEPHLHHSPSGLVNDKKAKQDGTVTVGIENGQETARLMIVDSSPAGPWPAGQEP